MEEQGQMSHERKEELTALLESLSFLQKQSDRAMGVIGAADLDEDLGDLLRTFFIDHTEFADNLLSEHGVLGAFASRIKIAFALGLISEGEYKNLDLIREIRKRFAHRPGFEFSFETPEIKDRCLRLQTPKEVNGQFKQTGSPRDRYMTTCTFLRFAVTHHLEKTSHRVRPQSVTEEEIVSRLKEEGLVS